MAKGQSGWAASSSCRLALKIWDKPLQFMAISIGINMNGKIMINQWMECFFFRSPGFSDKLRLGERSAKCGDFTNKNVEMFMGNKHSQTFSFPSFPCISRVLYFPIFHIKLPERGFRRYSRQVLKHVSLLISISLIYNIFSNIFSISFPYLFHQFGAAGLVPTRGRDGHQASAETALMEAINTMCLGPAEGAKQKEESATETTGKCHG
jgi:hypothetical protein